MRVPRLPSLLVLAGCLLSCVPLQAQHKSVQEPNPPAVTPAHYRIYNADGKAISLERMLARLREVDVVFLGENHDDPVAHHLELKLLEGLEAGRKGRKLILALEMFERDVQPVLDEYLAGLITEQHFLAATRPWQNYAKDYRPLVEFARQKGLPVVASNAPRRYVNVVGRLGAEGLNRVSEPSLRGLPPLPYAEASEPYARKFKALMAHGHGQTTRSTPAQREASLKRGLQAQSLWDASMAFSIAEALKMHPGGQVLHVNGAFHTESRLGIPEHLLRYRPDTTFQVVTVLPHKGFPKFPADRAKIGDFVVIADPSLPRTYRSASVQARAEPLGKLISKETLLARTDARGKWSLVPADGAVSSGDTLTALPGFNAILDLKTKVQIELWGAVPELFQPGVPLLESSVRLHGDAGFDADFRLRTGRVYVENGKDKGSAKVKVRFADVAAEVTLEEPGTTIGLETWHEIPASAQERRLGMRQVFGLYVLKGKVSLKLGETTFGGLSAAPGQAFFAWDSFTRRGVPQQVQTALPYWKSRPDVNKNAGAILDARPELLKALGKAESLTEAALKASGEGKGETKVLAVRALAALEDTRSLLAILAGKEKREPSPRLEALAGLRRWLARDASHRLELYDPAKKTGLLTELKIEDRPAATAIDLLFGPTREALEEPETYALLIALLRHPQALVRELAHQNLVSLVPAGLRIRYDAFGPDRLRDAGYSAWKGLIPDGKLPPKPQK